MEKGLGQLKPNNEAPNKELDGLKTGQKKLETEVHEVKHTWANE